MASTLDIYTHGHDESVVARHRQRTAKEAARLRTAFEQLRLSGTTWTFPGTTRSRRGRRPGPGGQELLLRKPS